METKKVEWQLVILVCSIIIIMIMGVRQSLGLFLEPITNFMNSGKEFFSFAIGVQAIIWGLVTFFFVGTRAFGMNLQTSMPLVSLNP